MKKILLALCLLPLGAMAQVLQDGSFENWSSEVIFEQLDWWHSSPEEGGPNNTYKSTDAAEGLYSVYMETVLTEENDTAFGYALYGEFGDEGPEQGLPFLTLADTVKVSVKYNVMPGDTAIMLVAFTLNGNTQSMDVFHFTGTQQDWTEVAFPLSIGTQVRDSVIIAFASSNALGEVGITPGSWLQVDDVHFASSITPVVDEVRNGDFEDWEEVVLEDLNNWHTFNRELVGLGQQAVRKVSGKTPGTFGARLETLELVHGDGQTDTIHGVVSNAYFDSQGNQTPTIYTGTTSGRVMGDFKYSPAGPNDPAFISLRFYLNGSELDEIGYAFENFTPVYTAFEFDYQLEQLPDSFELNVFSGNTPGAALTIDNLEIIDLTSVNDYKAHDVQVSVYPNPVKDVLNLELSGLKLNQSIAVKLFDVLGNEVQEGLMSQKGNKHQATLDVNALSGGVYFYKCLNGVEVINSGKFTKY